MKLCRLDLLRYGHLSDVTLAFPENVRLHVVHGANEAGKSTALAAIADALFGFGHRTDFDFLHGAPHLRVGFTLAARGGAMENFVRRKGRRDTLRDMADQVVPDEALRRFLGGVSRDLFERGFGLDGARLREGGRELLRLGGEAGESLLAGAGLLNLRAVLAQIDEEAKSLVGDGRGRRRLSDAVEAWRKALRESEERAVVPRAWQEAEATYAASVTELTSVQRQIRTLAEEDNRLQRMRRVAPLLAQLTEAHENLALLSDAPHLPPDAENRFQALVAAQRDAARDSERETVEVQRVTATYTALPQDVLILQVQDAIDALVAQRAIVLQATNDLPKVQASAASLRTSVAEAIRELGLSLAPEAARDALPTAAVLRTVRRLITAHAALTAEAKSAERAMAVGIRRRDQAMQGLVAAPETASPALLRRTIDVTRGEGPLDTDLSQAQRTLAEAEHSAVAALTALPLWPGDLVSLAACPLPFPAEVDAVAARLHAAAQQVAKARADVADLAIAITDLDEEVSRLSRGAIVPTPDVVIAARAARDRVWRVIRRTQEGGPATADEGEDGLPEGHLPDIFEALRDQADQLADRRADEAQRVADFLSATDRLAVARRRRSAADAVLAAGEEAAAQAEVTWRTLWAPAGLDPLAPPAMAEWCRARAEVLRLGEVVATVRRQRDDLAARRDRAQTGLAALLPDVPPQETLSALLLRAETACVAEEVKVTEHGVRKQALADTEERLPELRQSMEAAAAALELWRREWSTAVAALGLPADATIDTTEAAIAAWARIAEAVPAWRTDEGRIAAMNTSVEAFSGDLHVVLGRLDGTVTDEPLSAIAARLGRRLAEARKAASDADELTKQIVAHQQAAIAATSALAAAEAELETLRRAAGVTDNPALEQAIERARQRDVVAATVAHAEQALTTLSDGMLEAALRAEATQIDPDVVVGRHAEIETQLASLGERREELSAQRTRAEAVLTEMRQGHDAAAMAQQAEDALAEARDAAERYARLHVARVLLRAGIDRFRKEQQGPLLRAAGAHFALLTGGRYERLIVDYDAAGRTVLIAIRDMGAECPVEALSEGARDQLYLALRVASVEAYAAQTEPLPFIADDLLVHFDDTRAAAAIALLAEVGQTTQVILFTHHDHIVSLAERQAGVAVQALPPITISPTTVLAVV